MRIRKHDVGPGRWHLTAWSSGGNEDREFWEWMRINCPECMCIKRSQWGTDPHWEIRGSDRGQMMLIMMAWST
jgi:hypothetical protein